MRIPSAFVDTSGWAANVRVKEDNHERAQLYLATFRRDKTRTITTNWVLCELIALLTARGGMARTDLLDYVGQIQSASWLEVVTVTPEIEVAAYQLLRSRLDKAYSLCDAASFVYMAQNDISAALTSDSHFAQEGFVSLLTASEPAV